MAVEIQASVYNDKGRVRGNNEDNFFLNGRSLARGELDGGAAISNQCADHLQVYAVCDGMGGTDAGEEAALLAVNEFARVSGSSVFSDREKLKALLQSVSDSIYGESEKKQRRSGTTAAMVIFHGSTVTVANVGDSRIYRLRGDRFEQLSVDHSRIRQLLQMGLIAPEEIKTHPERHVITQFLGMPPEISLSPSFRPDETVREGDVYLICSDGLTDMLEDAEIRQLLKSSGTAEEAAGQLMRAALIRGGHDNVTVMVLKALRVRRETQEMADRKTIPPEPEDEYTVELPSGNHAVSAMSASAARTHNRLREKILTGIQCAAGAALVMVVVDFIYYLLS